jgi:hypothetical protein
MARLTQDLVDYLNVGLAHQVGACGADGQPHVVRALALLQEEDGRLSVLLSALANPELLRAVRSTRQVAVVLSQPTNLRTIQIKGADAEIHEAETARYRGLLAARGEAFWSDVERLGFSRVTLSNWYDVPEGALVRIVFTPYGAWNQTPGPGAGVPVELLP